MATVIAQRVTPLTMDSVAAFLKPSLNTLVPPWRMDDMDKAATRLAKAIQTRERCFVYGDYDTDGVTACPLMIRACRAAGYSLEYRLPPRFEEGYGISTEFPDMALQDKVHLVVTVDSRPPGP